MNKELRDQSAHFGSCLGFSLLGGVPVLGPVLNVWLWAITREYYQHKDYDLSFMGNVRELKFFNLDMKWSWVGILVGVAINSAMWGALFFFGILVIV